ncbi:MAG: energy-coupling factor transporter transmembrane protein EcfT [Propionibacteriales bacterium]|nr:energy-coupling factor transporter transmembrane protein EcfT [Propionibacteriales bacterium]
MRPVDLPSYSRNLHPGAWWLWAIGLAAAASRTTNPAILLIILGVTGLVVAARRSDAPWANAYAAFLKLALVVIAIRVVLQSLLSSQSQGVEVLFTLPEIPLPDAAAGIKLGGMVTAEAVLRAFYEGLQLATILCCVGAANALASARRLLRSVPGALYELGVATVVALTFAPQLVTDAARVRAAHRLRGRDDRGLRSLARTVMPVLEGALDRSVELAASMDSRGYGRTTDAGRVSRLTTGLLTFGGLFGVCVGMFGLLDGSSPPMLGLPSLLAGVALSSCGIAVGGRRTRRTRYRPDPWALPEWMVSGCGFAAAAAMFATAAVDPAALHLPGPLAVPEVPWIAVGGVLIAALPARLAPSPPSGSLHRAVSSPARSSFEASLAADQRRETA